MVGCCGDRVNLLVLLFHFSHALLPLSLSLSVSLSLFRQCLSECESNGKTQSTERFVVVLLACEFASASVPFFSCASASLSLSLSLSSGNV